MINETRKQEYKLLSQMPLIRARALYLARKHLYLMQGTRYQFEAYILHYRIVKYLDKKSEFNS